MRKGSSVDDSMTLNGSGCSDPSEIVFLPSYAR